jgi:cation:H+ antiporter
MLTIFSLSILALTFFFILAHGADLLVGNLRALADHSKIHPVLLGLILGFLTTVPEFMVGLNAIRQGVTTLSLGNIWGGIIVILALILGLSIILQRKIKTDGHLFVILPSFIFILFSLFLGTKGVLNFYDGLFLLIFYLIIVYLDFLAGGHYQSDILIKEEILEKEGIKNPKPWFGVRLYNWHRAFKKEISWALVGLVLVVVASYVIMEIADIFLGIFPLPPFLVGLLIFSLGTNLPEITVMLRSLKLKSADISFGHLVGSAVSNVLVLALLTFFTTIDLTVSWRYYVLMCFMLLTVAAISWFYVSKKSFDRWEGIALLFLYFAFVFYEIFL